MKTVFTICFLLFVNLPAFSQSRWVKNIGGIGDDFTWDITYDAAGNVYTTGEFRISTDLDPGPGVFTVTDPSGFKNVFIQKLDSMGNFIWGKNIGGGSIDIGFSIVVDTTGNVYVAGMYEGLVDFDPGPGSFMLTGSGSYEIFILKLDPMGNFLWVKSMGGASQDYLFDMAIDLSGNIYSTGFFNGTSDFDPGTGTFNLTSSSSQDIFVSKLDPTGNFVWAKKIGDTGTDWSRSIITDTLGNVYIAGLFNGTVDFDPGTGTFNLTSAGGNDIFVCKIDAAGNFMWAKGIGDTSDDVAYSIAFHSSGNIYATGSFSGTADFISGPGTYNLTSAGASDIFILNLDEAGNFIWAKSIGSTANDEARYISVDHYENIYTTGFYSSVTDFNPGPGIFNLSGDDDIFISKLDATGNFVWAKRLGGGALVDRGQALAISPDGALYTTGYFRDTADFDIGTGTINFISNGGTDVFISKTSVCALTSTIISQTDLTCNGGSNGTATVGVSQGRSPYMYSWVPTGGTGATASSLYAGTYNCIITDADLCTVTQAVNITEPPIIATSQNLSICAGETVMVGSSEYNSSGIYTDLFTAINGCDSTVTTNLTVNLIDTVITATGFTLTANQAGAVYQWMNCENNTLIPGENGQAFTSSGSGNYAVIITLNSCSDTSACTSIFTNGINNKNDRTIIDLYPNPARDHINITIKHMVNEIDLVDCTGRTIITVNPITENVDVDISQIKAGIYFINVREPENTYLLKLIKI